MTVPLYFPFPNLNEQAMSALRGLRILVVENDEMNATLLELQLAQAGAEVVGVAASVQQALALIDSERPDRAVLDFRLSAGETSEPVARALSERGTPFVLANRRGRRCPAHRLRRRRGADQALSVRTADQGLAGRSRQDDRTPLRIPDRKPAAWRGRFRGTPPSTPRTVRRPLSGFPPAAPREPCCAPSIGMSTNWGRWSSGRRACSPRCRSA